MFTKLPHLLLIAACSAAIASCGLHAQNQTEEPNMEKPKPGSAPPPPGAAPLPPMATSRPAPPSVPPVTFEGIRYQQVMNAQPFGHDQRTGYLAAYEGDNSEPLWLLKVYELTTIEHLEQDVQEVYFSRMELKPAKRQLLIENEIGQQFVVDLDTKTVSTMK